MRLNKYISDTGYCSRREADRLVSERRVTVNGLPAGIGTQVGEGDRVEVDGQALSVRRTPSPAPGGTSTSRSTSRSASPAPPTPR